MSPPKIDDKMWARMASIAELPPRARFDLEQIMVEEWLAYPWKKGAAPNKINEELKKLKAHVDRLCEGLRTISVGGAYAMLSTKPAEDELDDVAFLKILKAAFLSEPDTDHLELYGSYGEALRGLRDWLGRARATKGTRPLEQFICRLDRFLNRYTNRDGFARTSQPKRNARGGNGHHEFAVAVVGATLGEGRYKPSTIDDVIKDTIQLRRKLKPRRKRRQSAGLK